MLRKNDSQRLLSFLYGTVGPLLTSSLNDVCTVLRVIAKSLRYVRIGTNSTCLARTPHPRKIFEIFERFSQLCPLQMGVTQSILGVRDSALERAYNLYIALTGASDGISVGDVKKVIGLFKNRLKYDPLAPQRGARVVRTERGTRDR